MSIQSPTIARGMVWCDVPRDAIVVVNKVDIASPKQVLEQLTTAAELDLSEYFPVSAVTGAGIVADSDPQLEEYECRNKAAALLAAVPAARRMTKKRLTS